MKILLNKVAIVTGASSGIGRATAKLFAKQGAKVIVAARRQWKLKQLVDEITAEGGNAQALPGNVTEESCSKALVNFAIEEYGRLDIAFNNAGILGETNKTMPDISLESWQNTINTNLTSAFLGAKYQIPAMQDSGSGSVIFTSSFVGHTIGMPYMSAYAASKAGIVGLTKVLASEFGSEGIRVNALLPGGTDTPMGSQSASTHEAMDFVKSIHALKRIASPEEIAQSALFLASTASSFLTGTALMVDGGASICKT